MLTKYKRKNRRKNQKILINLLVIGLLIHKEKKMSKTIDKMIEEIAEKRCESIEVQELEQFYIDTKTEQFEKLDDQEIIEMYISEVDKNYKHQQEPKRYKVSCNETVHAFFYLNATSEEEALQLASDSLEKDGMPLYAKVFNREFDAVSAEEL